MCVISCKAWIYPILCCSHKCLPQYPTADLLLLNKSRQMFGSHFPSSGLQGLGVQHCSQIWAGAQYDRWGLLLPPGASMCSTRVWIQQHRGELWALGRQQPLPQPLLQPTYSTLWSPSRVTLCKGLGSVQAWSNSGQRPKHTLGSSSVGW